MANVMNNLGSAGASEAPSKESGGLLPERAGPFLVIGSLDVGGAESHVVRIVPRLKSLGWNPVVYCLSHRGKLAPSLADAGIEVLGPQQSEHRLFKTAS
ncbi:MAG: hypothetical protein VX871_10580, partial [Pseudomonadota bacterium]|nr:hypothetical protein [Pseudomonadota bacterium]